MADTVARFRSVIAAGMGTEAATSTIESALRARGTLEVHRIAPGRLCVSRTRRPTWALVACVCTVWLGGLGLLFLLVTRTDAAEVGVVDGPRGATVTLPPMLDTATVQSLEAALRGGGADERPLPAPPTPAVDGGDLEDRTIARSPAHERMPASPPVAAPSVALRFDDAVLVVEHGHPVVLGRDPSPAGDAIPRRVPGDATTVSKSHLLVRFDGRTASVEDLGSTNGSALTRGGTTTRLAAGAPTPVADGDRVAVGTVEFVVDVHGVPAELSATWT